MHLQSIKIRGFKSFVDPIELKLEPGVAVVVGPNGSGKSNVADAIVWAAGSLTPSELRAEKPDDVLFGGAANRPAADHCEVELVFDNADGGFGDEVDFSEIAITRRLVRGGEGQYLVNKAAVRRTDLVELLADVGLGGSMHSIVSQGKVDAVLASKPEDRRHLVEEAAGLGKFKRRKHRAELKLARVGIQVERAKDVEEEVRKRLRPLALQATAAERAEKLAIEIAALRARIAQLDLLAVTDRRADAEARRDAVVIARRSTQEQLTALLEERQQAEDELSDAAGGRETALGALYRLQGASERLVLRRESAAELEQRLRGDLAEAERAAADRSDETVRILEEAARAAATTARDAAEAHGQAAERARHAHARIAVYERSLSAEAQSRLAELRGERGGVEAALAGATGGQEGANRRLVALGAARERLGLRQESAATLVEKLTGELEEARAIARRGGLTPAELEARANEATAAARAAATERDDVAERSRSVKERLQVLESAIAEREGIPPAASALAAAGETLALSALEAEPGAERAIAAALAWRASAVLARDAKRGLELLERTRKDGLGSLTVIVDRDAAAASSPPVAGARPLRELAAGDPAALRLLDGFWLVPAAQLLDAGHGTVITTEGHGYDAERGELWFAGETAEAVLLEMDARRRALADEAEELTGRAAAAAHAAAEAAEAAATAEAEFAAVAHLRERNVDPVRARRARRGHHHSRELARACPRGDEAARGAARGAPHDRRPAGRRARSRAAPPLDARGRRGPRGGGLRGTGTGGRGRRRPARRQPRRPSARRRRHRASSSSRRQRRCSRSPREPPPKLALLPIARATPTRPCSSAHRGARRSIPTCWPACSTPSTCWAPGSTAPGSSPPGSRRPFAPASMQGQNAPPGSGRSCDGSAPPRSRCDSGPTTRTSGRPQIQVELARLDAEAEEAQRRLDEAGADEPAEGDDRAELATRAERLDARREALGKVNPLAKEEYEEEKERLEELATQRQDLEASLAEIAKLRDELAETVQRRFNETFETVARNFEEVAATLFPGGEGRLRLVEPGEDDEGNELEAGVEVELRPAGKRITRLTLLSGGEKALGAISFLFALFLAKPCPFYLLDEVEAALDDANVTRFVELLRRYSDRAQFIVITHQKRTMEAADVLYGVTMGGDGVSQVVSRRLPQHDQVAAASA